MNERMDVDEGTHVLDTDERTHSTHVSDVFTDVDADPDAVLADAGFESPETLVAGGGRYDPIEAEADETAVADLLSDLTAAAIEIADTDEQVSGARADPDTPDIAVSEPSVTVLEGDCAAMTGVFDRERQETPERKLVGSGPTVRRIATDSFGNR